MLKTKTFKLEKPKKSDGWAKFVEWNRQWNKILSVIFGILSFSLLFAIVLANILHTDYRNYEILTTTSTTTTSTSTSTTTTEEPIIISTTTPEVLMPTEEAITTEVYETTTTPNWPTEPTYPTTTPIYDTTTRFGPVRDPTTTSMMTTSVPPVITTYPTIPVFTTTSIDLEATSAGLIPSPKCDLKKCTLNYCVLFLATCTATCEGGNANEDTTSTILTFLTKLVCDKAIDLEIINCDLTTNSLRAKWLDIKTKVLSLNMDVRLERIEQGAFSSDIFSDTHTITIQNSQIAKLDSVFHGLSSLTTLNFYGAQFLEITGNAFTELINLQTLNLDSNSFPIRLENVTGSDLYSTITYVSVRHSEIRSLPSRCFAGVPRLRNINLQGSEISHIDPEAFDGASEELLDVYLNDNLLSTVDTGVFSQAILRRSLQINLENNPWNCDCSPGMKELQMLMTSPSTMYKFPGDVRCSEPVALADLNIRTADMECLPATTTISTISSTVYQKLSTPYVSTTERQISPSEITTKKEMQTPPYDTTVSAQTTNRDDSGENDGSSRSTLSTRPTRPPLLLCPIDDNGLLTAELTISIDNGHRFNLTEVEEGVVHVKIHPSFQHNVNLFWFMNIFMEFDPVHLYERKMSCRSDLEQSVLVRDLIVNSIYTFCMVPITKPEISPFDCLSIYLQPSKADRPWLRNRDRLMTFGVVAMLILTMFVLGVVMSCLCCRKPPNIFSWKFDSARTSQDVIMMPPLPKRNKTSIPYKSSRPLQRSASDTSLASGRSYVSAINPSPFEVIAWKMDRNRLPTQPVFYNLEKMPEGPPPIPPPKRPSDTSHYSNVDEIYERSRRGSVSYNISGNHYINYRV